MANLHAHDGHHTVLAPATPAEALARTTARLAAMTTRLAGRTTAPRLSEIAELERRSAFLRAKAQRRSNG
jgi:hypothetical protein